MKAPGTYSYFQVRLRALHRYQQLHRKERGRCTLARGRYTLAREHHTLAQERRMPEKACEDVDLASWRVGASWGEPRNGSEVVASCEAVVYDLRRRKICPQQGSELLECPVGQAGLPFQVGPSCSEVRFCVENVLNAVHRTSEWLCDVIFLWRGPPGCSGPWIRISLSAQLAVPLPLPHNSWQCSKRLWQIVWPEIRKDNQEF